MDAKLAWSSRLRLLLPVRLGSGTLGLLNSASGHDGQQSIVGCSSEGTALLASHHRSHRDRPQQRYFLVGSPLRQVVCQLVPPSAEWHLVF